MKHDEQELSEDEVLPLDAQTTGKNLIKNVTSEENL